VGGGEEIMKGPVGPSLLHRPIANTSRPTSSTREARGVQAQRPRRSRRILLTDRLGNREIRQAFPDFVDAASALHLEDLERVCALDLYGRLTIGLPVVQDAIRDQS
jgi:hypothetical protein